MDDIKVLYPSDPDLSTEALVEAVNDLLSINSVARPFVREQGDWRFVDELGGDGFFPDYINLVLVFVSANVLTEFVKSFAGKAGSILAERLFERIEKGKNDCESDLDQATHEQKLADKSKENGPLAKVGCNC